MRVVRCQTNFDSLTFKNYIFRHFSAVCRRSGAKALLGGLPNKYEITGRPCPQDCFNRRPRGRGLWIRVFSFELCFNPNGWGQPLLCPQSDHWGGGYVPPCAPRHSVPVGPHLSRGGFSKSSFSFKNTNWGILNRSEPKMGIFSTLFPTPSWDGGGVGNRFWFKIP